MRGFDRLSEIGECHSGAIAAQQAAQSLRQRLTKSIDDFTVNG